MASAYSGQGALMTAAAAPPQSNDAGGAGVLAPSTTLETYVPPKCMWSTKRGDEKAGGGIVVYKISSVSTMITQYYDQNYAFCLLCSLLGVSHSTSV